MPERLIITGPESSGKTTLAEALSDYFSRPYVEEYARPYLKITGGHYEESDLRVIAEYQRMLERNLSGQIDGFPLVCDTSMLVLKIWSLVQYDRVHPVIERALRNRRDSLYVLCSPDFPWEPDPLREHPNRRDALFERYRKELEEMGAQYIVVRGPAEERLDEVVQWVDEVQRNK